MSILQSIYTLSYSLPLVEHMKVMCEKVKESRRNLSRLSALSQTEMGVCFSTILGHENCNKSLPRNYRAGGFSTETSRQAFDYSSGRELP